MLRIDDSRVASLCVGRIVRLDPTNRSMIVRLSDGELLDMVIAPGCSVFLNGEAVRLRLLLVGDEVEIEKTEHGEDATALHIAVRTRPGR